MKPRDLALAILVVIVWGANFTVIKLGLDGMPPMVLAALRYALTALPAIFFVRRPAVEARYCFAYGLSVGVGQFGCLFYAMAIGMPAGAASVILQAQAFFTLLLAAALLGERIEPIQMVGLAIAAAGLYAVGGSIGTTGVSAIPTSALLLTLAGAACWGFSNIVVRRMVAHASKREQRLDLVSLVVWSSLVPPIPLLLLAFTLDSPERVWSAIVNLNALSLAAVLYLAFGATLFGFGTWSGLLSRYPAARVAPLSLLVPVTGLITAHIALDERFTAVQWLGGFAVLAGLIIGGTGGPKARVQPPVR